MKDHATVTGGFVGGHINIGQYTVYNQPQGSTTG